MLRLLLGLAICLGALAAAAQVPAETTATANAVEFSCRVGQPPAAATSAVAVSVALYAEADPAANLRCIALASGQQALVSFALAFSPADPNPRIRARAYSGASCSGIVSPASPNACRVAFPVGSPSFVP